MKVIPLIPQIEYSIRILFITEYKKEERQNESLVLSARARLRRHTFHTTH